MPLPVSKSALDRLGVRLVAGDSISDNDLAELARIVNAYQDVLNGVKLRLGELGFSATARMKTTGTLVDKLRRETARLSQVQDLAGARIVVPDRAAQDDAASRIADAFESAGCTCKVIDRREYPSHGYRAVHLVLQVDKVPVEIRVRTDLQDSWAQLVERIAGIWGRGIRYGEEPDAPDSLVEGLTSRPRRGLPVDAAQRCCCKGGGTSSEPHEDRR
jgi:ppGpp synthetase/RelA/SpoT-type nucleotidyltranferase